MGIEKTIAERSLVFGLADSAPLFVIDGRVYYCLRGRSASPDTLLVKDRKIDVREGPLLETLERISDKKLEKECVSYQEKFIARELKGREDTGKNNRLIRFVVTEIFPHLKKDNPGVLDKVLEMDEIETEKDKLKGRKIKNFTYEKEIERYAEDRIKELEKGKLKVRKPKTNKLENILFNQNLSKSSVSNSILYDLTEGFNFGVVSKTVYLLANVSSDGELFVNGRRYNLVTFAYSDEIAMEYAAEKVKRLSVEALTIKLKESEEFLRIRRERSDIDEICKMDSYHEQDFGFMKKNSYNAVVYVDVPDYALEDREEGGLYQFNGHRLGIEIGYEDDSIQLVANPFALRYVAGPFYGGDNDLCMGDYSTGYFNRMAKGKAFAKLLVDARNVVLKGYRRGSNPRQSLSGFSSRRISREEAERRCLEITNTNYQRSRRGELEEEDD